MQKRIITVEEPVEYELRGINQIAVRPEIGLTFAMGLRHILRQDPNVIMVGEIRDLETAEIAIKAAQTGHLVLSTLHTNDAPTTLERMKNMGIAPFNIASSVIMITAQRLARRLCSCKKPISIPMEALLQAGFHEHEIQRIIMTNGNSIDIAEQAQQEGIKDLRQSGLLKVKQGLTSLEEVLATTNE